MKSPFIFLLLLAVVVSCAPDPDPPDRLDNDLIHYRKNRQLTPTMPTYKDTLQLTCGCDFVLHTDGAGDTSIIKYAIPPLDSTATHQITISASTTGLASGTYTSWLALWSYDWEKGMLRDTLNDTLIVP